MVIYSTLPISWPLLKLPQRLTPLCLLGSLHQCLLNLRIWMHFSALHVDLWVMHVVLQSLVNSPGLLRPLIYQAITYIKILTLAQSMVLSLWRCVPLVVSTIVWTIAQQLTLRPHWCHHQLFLTQHLRVNMYPPQNTYIQNLCRGCT